MKLKDILRESQLLSEGRKEKAREKYPNIPQEVFDIFVEGDPSGNHKYLMSVCKMWEDRWSSRSNYYYGDKSNATGLMNDVKYFHENPNKYEIKDLNQYGYNDFKDDTKNARLKLTKGEIKKQANKLYETDKYLVVEPTTHATSCYYGSGTRWCTTSRHSDQYFKQYYGNSSLFYFINKKNGKKRAFQTPLVRTMFGGEIEDPDFEYHKGNIYTEADNLGRSMKGIPIEARMAMHKRHIEKAIERDPSIENKIRFGKKVLTRVIRGDLRLGQTPPNSIKRVEGDLRISDSGYRTDANISLNRIKTVDGDVTLRYGVSDLGDLERVGGDLNISNSNVRSLKNLNYVGGDLNVSSRLTDLGSLKYVGGELDIAGTSISIEDLKKLDHVESVTIDSDDFQKLVSDFRLPNLPNTPIELR